MFSFLLQATHFVTALVIATMFSIGVLKPADVHTRPVATASVPNTNVSHTSLSEMPATGSTLATSHTSLSIDDPRTTLQKEQDKVDTHAQTDTQHTTELPRAQLPVRAESTITTQDATTTHSQQPMQVFIYVTAPLALSSPKALSAQVSEPAEPSGTQSTKTPLPTADTPEQENTPARTKPSVPITPPRFLSGPTVEIAKGGYNPGSYYIRNIDYKSDRPTHIVWPTSSAPSDGYQFNEDGGNGLRDYAQMCPGSGGVLSPRSTIVCTVTIADDFGNTASATTSVTTGAGSVVIRNDGATPMFVVDDTGPITLTALHAHLTVVNAKSVGAFSIALPLNQNEGKSFFFPLTQVTTASSTSRDSMSVDTREFDLDIPLSGVTLNPGTYSDAGILTLYPTVAGSADGAYPYLSKQDPDTFIQTTFTIKTFDVEPSDATVQGKATIIYE